MVNSGLDACTDYLEAETLLIQEISSRTPIATVAEWAISFQPKRTVRTTPARRFSRLRRGKPIQCSSFLNTIIRASIAHQLEIDLTRAIHDKTLVREMIADLAQIDRGNLAIQTVISNLLYNQLRPLIDQDADIEQVVINRAAQSLVEFYSPAANEVNSVSDHFRETAIKIAEILKQNQPIVDMIIARIYALRTEQREG